MFIKYARRLEVYIMEHRKYPQIVFSQMNRFSNSNGGYYLDENNTCFLVRNKTKIYFGECKNILGTVIMTNPGSYGLGKIDGWEKFKRGEGEGSALLGSGYADLTMQNIILVVNEAFEEAGKKPDGYLAVYNISSVVCPKGKKADSYHAVLSDIVDKNRLGRELLVDPVVKDQEKFMQVFEESPFVMMGFVKGAFNSKVYDLLRWAEKFQNKIISYDESGWPSHPRRWRTEVDLRIKAKQKLMQVIDSGG